MASLKIIFHCLLLLLSKPANLFYPVFFFFFSQLFSSSSVFDAHWVVDFFSFTCFGSFGLYLWSHLFYWFRNICSYSSFPPLFLDTLKFVWDTFLYLFMPLYLLRYFLFLSFFVSYGKFFECIFVFSNSFQPCRDCSLIFILSIRIVSASPLISLYLILGNGFPGDFAYILRDPVCLVSGVLLWCSRRGSLVIIHGIRLS